YYRGEHQEALAHAEEGLALFELEQERRIVSTFQFSSACAIWAFRAQSHQLAGQAEQATRCVSSWGALTDQLRHAHTRAHWLGQHAFLCHMKYDVEGVERLASNLSSLSIAEGLGLWIPISEIFLAWANARQGGSASVAAEKIEAALRRVHEGRTHITDLELASM